MADNITLPGTGALVGTETVGSAQVQQVKILWGAVDTGTEVNTGTPLPVVQTGTPTLPTGAASLAKQPALGVAGTASTDVLTVQGIAAMTALKVDGSAVTQPVSGTVGVSGTVPVSGTFFQGTQPVSAASLPLPSGASTSAKQPALGTAGTASTDVLTVQGIASGTPINVSSAPTTSGGLTTYRNLDTGVTGSVVKSSAGQLYVVNAFNASTAIRYLKLYDKATAPTSSDTPIDTIALPSGGGVVIPIGAGTPFTTGLGVRGTVGVTDADTTAPSANDIVINLWFK